MEEARKKPKILLLRAPPAAAASAELTDAWARLAKALKTFTDLEERLLPGPAPEDLATLLAGYDHAFLDTELAPWDQLRRMTIPRLCLVQPESFPWHDPLARVERLDAIATHPFLLLEGLSAPDLLRTLHLYLTPKRLAGATPLMEKGSLILGEKVMEPNSVGLLLDRISTFCEKIEDFELKSRLPDLRQVLSALLLEGLRRGQEKGVAYPYVDFQLSPASRKLAVNLRFPRGNLSLDNLARDVLSGSDLFWHQIWQCSDLLVLTHHLAQDELEAMVLLCRPERNSRGKFRSFLRKTADQSARKDDLLAPPQSYRFMLVSEIVAKDGSDVQVLEAGLPEEDAELDALPEAAAQKIRQYAEQSRALHDHLGRKDEQIQELTKKNQQLTRDLNIRRAEVIKAVQARDAAAEAADRRVQELESLLAQLRDNVSENAQARGQQASGALQEVVARLEGTVRAAENEKGQLRESISHEQKRAAALETKYSHLFKELASRDREINDLKAALSKMRKDVEKPARAAAAEEKKDGAAARLKELEERELTYKMELKKLAYKIESQEKNLKFIQNDATEKQKLLDQKLKAAKAKEMELMRRIEELTNTLKKATKAA